MEMNGKLLVFEGLDGVGKTIQIDLLKTKFPGALIFKYPTRNTPELNDYLEKKIEIEPKELFKLFLADIRKEQEKILAALQTKKFVILDRYVFSTIAYETIGGYPYEDGKREVAKMGFIVPDAVLLLDIPSSVSQERKRKQKQLDRYEENAEYLEKVRERFLQLVKDKFLTPNWHKVDATKSISDVHREIMELLK